MNCIRALLAAIVMLFGAVSAHAQAVHGQGTWETTLQARDVGNTGTTNAFYDTALNITWLRDANVNGAMNWNAAMSWASSMTVGGVGGWRLPTMDNSAWNSDCWRSYGKPNCSATALAATGEMPHLFYETLGNSTYFDANGVAHEYGSTLTNTANFSNLLNNTYWSGTDLRPSVWIYGDGTMTNGAWVFALGDGETYPLSDTRAVTYAMAVHPGDVGTVVAPVPEPETYAMLLAGLALIGAIGRRRRPT